MTHAYLFLKPRAPLSSAYDAVPDRLHPHVADEVRIRVNASLHGVTWAVDPDAGAVLRGRYDGPGGSIELTLGTGHAEILTVRTTGEGRTRRLVRSLCDRTGWTALDLQTLALHVPREPEAIAIPRV